MLYFVIFVVAVMWIVVSVRQNSKKKAAKAAPAVTATVINTRQAGIGRYVTFETNGGNRIELQVPNATFGTYIIGDVGNLSYNGNVFESFQRK